MKNTNSNLLAGILLLIAGILNALNIDYDAYDWLDILPAILFTISGILFIREAFKKKKEENA